MTTGSDPGTAPAAVGARARGFWAYYRRYTKTGVHAAATAALTAFGLLIFIDSLFAWLAIASYVFPPVILYMTGHDAADDPDPEGDEHPESAGLHDDTDGVTAGPADADRDFDGPDRDSDGVDLDFDGPDADADGADADADADGANGDTDTDSDDGDTDTDSDDGDTDSDG